MQIINYANNKHIKQCNILHSVRLDAAAGRTGVYTGSANMVYNKQSKFQQFNTFFYVFSKGDGGAEHYPYILGDLFFMRLNQKEKKKTSSALV